MITDVLGAKTCHFDHIILALNLASSALLQAGTSKLWLVSHIQYAVVRYKCQWKTAFVFVIYSPCCFLK